MKYENRFNDIQMVIEEQIEVEEYELKGNGEPQFRVTMINGEPVADEDIILVDLKRTFSYMSSRSYIPIDDSIPKDRLKFIINEARPAVFINTTDEKIDISDKNIKYVNKNIPNATQPPFFRYSPFVVIRPKSFLSIEHLPL